MLALDMQLCCSCLSYMYVPSACKHGAHCRPHLAVVELRDRAAKFSVSPVPVILHVNSCGDE